MGSERTGRTPWILLLVVLASGLALGLFLLLGEAGPDAREGVPELEPPVPSLAGSSEAAPRVEEPRLERVEAEATAAVPPGDELAELLGGTRVEDLAPAPAPDPGVLLVRVTGPLGKPEPDVPVAICSDSSGRPFHFLVQRSDAAGLVHFRDLGLRLQPRGGDEPGYAVALAIPLADRERLPFDPRELPSSALELRMPPTGSIVVELLERDGSLVRETALVGLGPPGELDQNFRVHESVRSVAGRALFARVGVGEQFRLRAVVGGRPPVVSAVTGPKKAGEELRVELSVQGGYPELTGRALASSGTPLASGRGRVELLYEPGSSRVLPFTTDAEGRFRVRLFEEQAVPPSRLEFQLIDRPPGHEAILDELPPPLDGVTELGDVRFEPRPTLVTGRVSTGGQPLPGVSLRVEASQPDGSWLAVTALGSTTDAEGSFQIDGRAPAGILRLVARRRGFETGYLEGFSAGARGVQLDLRPAEGGEAGRGPVPGAGRGGR